MRFDHNPQYLQDIWKCTWSSHILSHIPVHLQVPLVPHFQSAPVWILSDLVCRYKTDETLCSLCIPSFLSCRHTRTIPAGHTSDIRISFLPRHSRLHEEEWSLPWNEPPAGSHDKPVFPAPTAADNKNHLQHLLLIHLTPEILFSDQNQTKGHFQTHGIILVLLLSSLIHLPLRWSQEEAQETRILFLLFFYFFVVFSFVFCLFPLISLSPVWTVPVLYESSAILDTPT